MVVVVNAVDNAPNDFAFAFYSADDWGFAGTDAASSAAASALIPMPVLGSATDESLIDFHDTHEFAEIFFCETSPHAMAHIPSRLVRAEALRHPDRPGLLITVPVHTRDLKRGTLRAILRQSGLTPDDLRSLL